MLTLRSVRKTYGQGPRAHVALKGIDLHVERGEFFTLLGPSGCGKTTALRCVAGLETPDSGEIRIGDDTVFDGTSGRGVPANRRNVSMVFQSYAIWPHMSVAENVGFPLEVQRVAGAERDARIARALDMVGLGSVGGRPATQLSGGQQQRVSLARAIVRGADLMLLDEPLSNLDAELRTQMRHELRMLQRRLGMTTLFVTHDQEEALSMSDRIALFERGELVEVGDPLSLYLRPRKRFTASFLGLGDPVDCTVIARSAGDGSASVRTPFGDVTCARADVDVGQRCRLLVRPEHVVLDAFSPVADNVFVGTVKALTFAGRYVEYELDVGGCALAAQASSVSLHEVGREVRVHLPPQRCVLLAD